MKLQIKTGSVTFCGNVSVILCTVLLNEMPAEVVGVKSFLQECKASHTLLHTVSWLKHKKKTTPN